MAERLSMAEGSSSQEGSSGAKGPVGATAVAERLDQPDVVIADEGKESKGPGFWRRITGRETKPLVLVQPPHVTGILNPAEQPENTTGTTQPPGSVNPQAAEVMQTGGGDGLPPSNGGDGGGGEPPGGGEGQGEQLNPQENSPEWWPFDKERWDALEDKDRMVDGAVLAMRYYYDMSNADREAKVEDFSAAYQDFAEYALGKKLYKWSDKDEKDNRIIALELELVNFDEAEIKKYGPEKQVEIIEALNKLDVLEHEQVGIKNGHRDFKITDQTQKNDNPPHVSKEEWEKYLGRPAQIEEELEKAEQGLIQLTSQKFVEERKSKKTTVEEQVLTLKKTIETEEEDKKKGIRVDKEQWELEQKLEERLLQEQDKKPELRESKESLPEFSRVMDFINEQEILKEAGDPKFWQEGYERAVATLPWYFHQARELGIFDDLEERLGGRYEELALALFSKSRTEQGDTEMETRRGSRNLSLAEAKEIIAKESDEHNLNSLTNTAELDASWRQLIRDDVISREDVNPFKGIRKAFVSGAYDQMYDSLSNLYKRFRVEELSKKWGPNDRRVRPVEIQRISGEWDVRKQEQAVRESLDTEEKAQEDKLFYVDRYYLTLTGTTEAQVDQGVNNYLTSLLEGAHVYDVQTIMQKMQYLSSAIMSKKDVLMQSGMSASAAQDALTRINILAENRGEFYVMNFSAQHLLMDEYFIPLYDKWAGVMGIEKMKKILDMNDGLVAPAMLLFLDKKNRLLFQPAGFKGQGMKDIWTQRTLRDKIKEQLAEELVNYQAGVVNSTELMEQTTWQDFLRMKFEERYKVNAQGKPILDERGKKIAVKPKEVAVAAKVAYDAEFKRVKQLEDSKKATKEDLESLRRVREDYTKRQNEYERLLVKANSAIGTTWQVFNIFGESARLGAPSIIMDKGDHIDIEEATYFYKFAILEAMKKNNDSPAKMRWRAYQWTKKPFQYDSNNPIVKTDIERDGVDATYTLVKRLADTGITQDVLSAFLAAAKELRIYGYNAALKRDEKGNPIPGYSFEEIISRNDVRPVRNNFISNYKSSREIFANPTAMREAKKGRQPFIMNILDRLDQSGRGKFTALDRAKIDGNPLEELPDEKLKELFEDAITDSFVFHITARQLTLWEATLQSSVDAQGNISYVDKFSTDRIYYGSQDIPWGVKRLQYLTEYWMTNKRERVGRAWKLLPFIPLLKSGLAQECDAENLPDLIFNVNKEHIDEPGLRQVAAGYKDAQGWRQRGETSVDEQRGETNWAWWDKLTVDAAQIFRIAQNFPPKSKGSMELLGMFDYIDAKDPAAFAKEHPLLYSTKKDLVEATREILKREAPLNVFLEAQLGYNRSAGGSGIGFEMGERWHYRVLNWWLSDEEGSRQEQGGLIVNDDVADYLKFITIKNSWSDGMSILDEAWRQARGTRDAGASDQLPRVIIA